MESLINFETLTEEQKEAIIAEYKYNSEIVDDCVDDNSHLMHYCIGKLTAFQFLFGIEPFKDI